VSQHSTCLGYPDRFSSTISHCKCRLTRKNVLYDEHLVGLRPEDEGGDAETDEDDATDDGDRADADLLGDQGSGEYGKAGAEGVAENAAEDDSGDVVDGSRVAMLFNFILFVAGADEI
jgi:hypothetical protein